MDFLLAAKYRYYGKDDSQNILQKVNREIPQNISACKHELLCIMNEVINLDPCCYWNRQVFNQTDSALQSIATQLPALSIDDTIFEFFLTGYNAYMQVTNVINDLSGLNDSPAMKNRQFRIPTYVSIVEGCLTNLYRFIALIINQTTTKDYASTYKLNSLCEILSKNGFDKLTESVNINIRNAINHGGIVFEEDGQTIVFHYTENKRSVSSAFTTYEFDQLINDVYDTASAIILGITVFLNLNWETVTVDGFVLGVEVTSGNVSDSVAWGAVYDKVTDRFPEVKFVTMDAGYKTPWIAKKVIEDSRIPILPYTRYKGKKDKFKPWDFTYNVVNDSFVCPGGHELRHTTTSKDGKRTYRSATQVCKDCPCRSVCGANENGQQMLTTHIWQEFLDLVEQLRKTERDKEIYALRKQTIARFFADAKGKHAMRYTHHRGLARVSAWVRLKYVAMNLKKLALWKWSRSDFFVFLPYFFFDTTKTPALA